MNEPITSRSLACLIGILGLAAVILLAAELPATGAGVLSQQEVEMTTLSINGSEPSTHSATESPPPDAAPFAVDDLIGGNFAISTATGNQYSPAVAWNGTSNEYLVVWHDYRTSSSDVYGQRVASNGALLGSNIPIAIILGLQAAPDTAWNATTNEYLVVWHDGRTSPSLEIYGQRASRNGTLVGGNFVIGASSHATVRASPVLAWNTSASEYLVVWTDKRNDIGDIYGQRVGSSGALVGSNFAISMATQEQRSPHIAWNATEDWYLVVWIDNRDGSHKIQGQRVTSGGSLLGDSFTISSATTESWNAVVTWNVTNNEFLVVWDGYQGGTQDIYGQRVSRIGALLGGNFPIRSATGEQWAPDLVWNVLGNEYLVVWSDGLGPCDIYGQRVRDSGLLLGNEFRITRNGLEPAANWNAASNEYLVVWRRYSSGDDIYGQRVAGVRPTPTPTLTPTPRATATHTPTPMPPQAYLPLILQLRTLAPAAPVLNSIAPPSASPSYAIRWSTVSSATSYVLQRATSASFADAIQVYAGEVPVYTAPSQGIARYYYRVKARNQWGDSTWSNVESVEVRWEQEPNYPLAQGNGPLISGLEYYGYPNDGNDYFFLQVGSRGQVTIDLTNHHGLGLQLLLRTPTGALVTQVNVPPYHLVTTVDPGRYYVHIYSTGGYNTTTPYTLRPVFP